MSNTETKTIYRQLGISEDVWIYGQKIEEGLKERLQNSTVMQNIIN